MRWRSLPQPSQCFSASARSCTIRSRTRCFARGCRPVRFLTGASGGFSSPPVAAAAGSSLASSGCRAFQSSSNSFSCSFESCSLLRLRWAFSSSRSRLRDLSFSALSCWSCSHGSTTIFCNTSTSFGSVLGSRGATCLQNNSDPLRFFQAKSNKDQNVLCIDAPIPLAPRSVAQIDAAQQRSEFFHADLKTPGARLSAGNCVGARFQTFCPDGKPIPVPVQNLEPISALVGEQVKMAGKWIQLEMIPHQRVQPVEAPAHVAGTQAQIHSYTGRRVNHRLTTSSTRRNVAASTPFRIRSCSPLARISSNGAALATVFRRANCTGALFCSFLRQ